MKKNTILLLMSLIVMFFFYSCSPDEETSEEETTIKETIVTITIGDATDISYCSATFSVALTANVAITDKGICFSSQDYTPTTVNSKISMGEGTGAFSVTLTQLEENTNYYARPYAITNRKMYYGEVKKFTTEIKGEGILINGVRWATRNVGSHRQFVDHPEDFGGYYQWGRKGDGHEQPTSNTTYTLSTTDNPPHGDFIRASGFPDDWRTPQNDNLWGAVKTDNDPCPAGWRVPTKSEFQSLINTSQSFIALNGVSGCFFGDGGQRLFLPAAGRRFGGVYGFNDVGNLGCYWSSSCSDFFAYEAHYYYSGNMMSEDICFRSAGQSVRCVAE